MDSGISDMINSVLSNPDALSKITAIMPAVAQQLNGNSGANNSTNIPDDNNLMSNDKVTAALKNLVSALNEANVANEASINNNAETTENNLTAAVSSVPTDTGIEKTLDTLKSFASVTNPENDHKSKLLLALKPFLKETRQTKIDAAIKYMNAAKLIGLFGKNGFV